VRTTLGLATASLSLLFLLSPQRAIAGVYGDELSKCLVEHTSDDDKIVLTQWIYAIMSVHPSAAALAEVAEADRNAVAKKAGGVFENLLTMACKDSTTKAVRYEGIETLKSSFNVLGQIAMTTLMTHPKVSAESENFVKFVDLAKVKAVFDGSSGGG